MLNSTVREVCKKNLVNSSNLLNIPVTDILIIIINKIEPTEDFFTMLQLRIQNYAVSRTMGQGTYGKVKCKFNS